MQIRRSLAPVATALAVSVLVAACGGGGTTPTAAPAEPTTAPSTAPAASAAPVAAITEIAEVAKVCVLVRGDLGAVKVMNPYLIGEMSPVIVLVDGKPVCKSGAGGKKILDAAVAFKAVDAQKAPIGLFEAKVTGPGSATLTYAAADGSNGGQAELVLGAPATDFDLGVGTVKVAAEGTEDDEFVIVFTPA